MAKKPKVKFKERRNKANLTINQDKLSTTLKKQWVVTAIDLLKKNHSNSYIREHILAHKEGSKTESAINTILSEAYLEITNEQFIEAKEIIPVHVKRYNLTIERLIETKDGDDMMAESGEQIDSETYWKLRNKKERAFIDCINTATQKEELLQYHNKDFTIEVNTEETIQIKTVKPKLNLDKLTPEQELRLYKLVLKQKKNDFELGAITVNTTEETVQTIDIDHEVVEKPNVEQIEKVALPPEKQEYKITREDPTIKLRESLKRLAAKQFVQAGGTLTKDEEKYIE